RGASTRAPSPLSSSASRSPSRQRSPLHSGARRGRSLLPEVRADDRRWVRCAVYTRQSVKRAGDDPATASSSTASIGSYGSSPLSRLAAFFERHRVGLTIVAGHIDADAGS